MTAGIISPTRNQPGIRFAQLPDMLIVLHAFVMTGAGIAWARNAAQMGSEMTRPAAYFWYDLTRLESYPVSHLCRVLTDLLAVQLRSSTSLSTFSAISMVYWVLLLVLGTVQWYLVGKFILWTAWHDEPNI